MGGRLFPRDAVPDKARAAARGAVRDAARAAAWALLIYLSSGRSELSGHNVTLWLQRAFFPGVPYATVGQWQFYARKILHFVEFAVLAVLLAVLLQKLLVPCRSARSQPPAVRRLQVRSRPARRAGWSPRPAAWLLAGLGAAGFAVFDEWHQSMVPGRIAARWDVAVDVAGVTAGLAALWLARRRRRPRPGPG